MVYVQWESFFFDREQGFRGREETNLLVHAYYSKFSVFPLFFPLPFLVLSPILWLSPRDYYYLDCVAPSVHGKGLFYSACRDWFLLF